MDKSLAVASISALMLSGLPGALLFNFPAPGSRALQPAAIRDLDHESRALIYIAKEMENGDVYVSVSTEYPVVLKALGKGDISIIGNIDKYHNLCLACSQDSFAVVACRDDWADGHRDEIEIRQRVLPESVNIR